MFQEENRRQLMKIGDSLNSAEIIKILADLSFASIGMFVVANSYNGVLTICSLLYILICIILGPSVSRSGDQDMTWLFQFVLTWLTPVILIQGLCVSLIKLIGYSIYSFEHLMTSSDEKARKRLVKRLKRKIAKRDSQF